MKVMILAGGFGTRLSEETDVKPKPMVEIGGKPILWHIMKSYSNYGFNEFVVLLGYKGYVIKEYFSNYFLHQCDVTFDIESNQMSVHQNTAEPWKVTLLDTGLNTLTGGRIKRARDYIEEDAFMLTYGDGLADIDLSSQLDFHLTHNKTVTMAAVQPAGRYGSIELGPESKVKSFVEKPKGDGAWINGGFFICNRNIFDYIDGDQTIFEQEPLRALAKDEELVAWQHYGFWSCMDTLRDKNELCSLWDQNRAPWKKW